MGDIFRKGQQGDYYIRWYEGGRRRVMATKQATHANAKRMLLEIEARVARGEAGMRERAAPLTVAQLVERFVEEYDRPKIKDPHRYRQQARSTLRRVLPTIGTQQADQVRPADIVRLRGVLGRKWAPASAKLTLNVLSSAYSWAVAEGLVTANPCRGVERPSTQHSLDYLSHDEAERLLSAAEANASDAASRESRMLFLCVAIALHTGLRKGEILGLRWIDVDLDALRLTVAKSYRGTTKSNKTRHLRLPAALAPLLSEWRERCPASPSGAIFPVGRRSDGVASCGAMLGLRRLMRKIGLREMPHPWHALRHTFASHFVMAGGNLLALQKILGHADIKVTMVYAHLSPDFLAGEMDRLVFLRKPLN